MTLSSIMEREVPWMVKALLLECITEMPLYHDP